MPRPRSAISPELPSRAKPKVEKVRDVWTPPEGAPLWRTRPTRPDPFGDPVRAVEGDEDEVQEQHRQFTQQGLEPILEARTEASWGPIPRPILTVLQLAKMGHAREVPDKPGVYRISDEGCRLLKESMTHG